MFFNEVELLRLRVQSLKDLVDYIVVIESSQTFVGRKKDFLLPTLDLDSMVQGFRAKIITISRCESISSYEDLVSKLTTANISDFSLSESQTLLDHVALFPSSIRNYSHLYLDRYQRECCRIYINRLCADDDLIIFSDADELPDHIEDIAAQYYRDTESVYSLKQHQFSFFPNYYEKDWYGSIVASKRKILSQSLNYHRVKVGERRVNTAFLESYHGYHMTNMGGVEMLKQKIQNWTHQEYNNRYVLNKLEQNIRSGSDVFMRSHGSILTLVELQDFYSNSYVSNIQCSSLELPSSIQSKKSSSFKRIIQRALVRLSGFIRSVVE